jgi:hypothetical protein
MSTFTIANNTYHNVSTPVVIESIAWHESTKTILAMCSDGNVRRCRTDRFTDVEEIKALVAHLRAAVKSGEPVSFKAKGNNSANKWFYALA